MLGRLLLTAIDAGPFLCAMSFLQSLAMSQVPKNKPWKPSNNLRRLRKLPILGTNDFVAALHSTLRSKRTT